MLLLFIEHAEDAGGKSVFLYLGGMGSFGCIVNAGLAADLSI
jgi:hypothetical protein